MDPNLQVPQLGFFPGKHSGGIEKFCKVFLHYLTTSLIEVNSTHSVDKVLLFPSQMPDGHPLNWECPPPGQKMPIARGSDILVVIVQGSFLDNAGTKQGPLRLNVPHLHWDAFEFLLEVEIEDPLDRLFRQAFPANPYLDLPILSSILPCHMI